MKGLIINPALGPSPRLNWLMLGAALLPSVLPVAVPVYEADVAALISRPEDHDFRFWVSFGRPLLFPIIMPLMGLGSWLGLPAAAHLMGLFYMLTLALWLWLLATVLGRILENRLYGAVAASLLALHFHFYEIRLWSGNNTLMAGSMVLAACAWVWRPGARRTRWRAMGVAGAAGFVALNLHQSGAFLLPVLAAMGIAADILHRRRFRVAPLSRGAVALVVGFAAACLVYVGEVLLIRATVGLPSRAGSSSWIENFVTFGKKLPLWAGAILPLPDTLRERPISLGALAVIMIGIAWKAPRGRARHKMRAAAVLTAGAIVACLPTLLTDGSLTSRILLPALVGLWGGGAIFMSCWQGDRWMMFARRGALLALAVVIYVAHWWGFGLTVAIKHAPVDWVRQLHQEMADAGVQPGDEITYFGFTHDTRSIAWSDSGQQLLATSWGAEAMFRPIFSGELVPPAVAFQWVPGAELQPAAPSDWLGSRLFAREEERQWGVNSGGICLRQLEIERRFRRAFRREFAIGMGALAACSSVAPGDGLVYRPLRMAETQFRLDQKARGEPTRLALTALDLPGPYQVSATCRNLTPTAQCIVEVGWSGRGRPIVDYELSPGANRRIDLSIARQPQGQFLTITVRGQNAPARIQFTRAEVKYDR